MAAGETNEEVLSEPVSQGDEVAEGDGFISNAADAIKGVGKAFLNKIGFTTNDAPTPPETVKTVPTLPEKVVQGYANGVAFDLTVVLVYGKWVEKNTAYDYLLMREAAKASGIDIGINVGFRPHEVQQALYRERMNPDGSVTPLGARLGRAAKPGFSNHQQGIALDLLVNMTVADRRAGNFSAPFIWLSVNAATYGFDNTEVPSEPWHWRHKPKTIVGPRAGDKDYLLSLVSASATAAAVGQRATKTDGQYALDSTAHGYMSAQARSAEMMNASRATLYANMGRFAVFRGAAAQQLAAMYAQQSASMGQAPPTISNDASKAIRFDFTTGKWGDGRPT